MTSKSHRLILGCSAAVAAICLAGHALAQERRFDIPAQDAATAISQFGLQSGLQITAPGDALRGVRTPAVRGELEPRVALRRLLEGTSLVIVQDNGRTIVLQSRRAGTSAQQGASPETSAVEDVVVTGTRLRGAGNDALPVTRFSRDEIDRSGQPNLTSFLSTVPQVSTSIPDSGFSGGGSNRQAGVQLRGLPAGTALVLLNGRRVEPGGISTGASVVDLNQVPIAAVERVEILPLGSSAIYGGDALAGVVNIILKDRMNGVAADVRYGSAEGTDDVLASVAAGKTFERGSALLLASWNRTHPLQTTERGFFASGDYRPFGGIDTRTRLCSPGTVTSVSGNLPGLGASFAAIPQAPTGDRPNLSQFASTAGQANLCDANQTGGGYALIPDRETYAIHTTGNFRFSNSLTAFGEFTYNISDVLWRSPGLSLNNVLVPATNAFNPFGAAVRVTTRLNPEYLQTAQVREHSFTRAVVGLRGSLGDQWDYELSAMRSGDDTTSTGRGFTVDTVARTAALASSDPASALNPFTSGRPASDSVLGAIFTDQSSDAASERTLVSGLLRGELFRLPGGPVQLAIGAERLLEDLDYGFTGGRLIDDRSSSSAFVEARLPLLPGADSDGAAFDHLAVTVAGRYDDYSDFGTSTTYQTGLEFRPTSELLLRGVVATSFKPPALLQTGLPLTIFDSSLFGLVDPVRNRQPVIGASIIVGPNPALVPETGEGRMVGLEWRPSALEGLRLSVNAWELDLENYIIRLAPQTIVDNEALFPGLVVRGPSSGGVPGPILEAASTYVNYGRLDVAGLDYDISYDWDSPLGRARAAFSASQMTRYNVVIVPGAPTEDRLGRYNPDAWAPEWKANVSLGLTSPDWSVGLTGRYLGEYADPGLSTNALGDLWTVDTTASLSLQRLSNLVKADRARLTLSVVNLTDEAPQFVSLYPYYDLTQGSWRGRYVSLRLSLNW